MHFHRDMLATCDSYGRHVLRAQATDRFMGSPPLAFTFGLGGLVLFPLHVGAATDAAGTRGAGRPARRRRRSSAPPSASPRRPPIARCWRSSREHDISSLRKCVSAGETLPQATFDAWHAATGIKILDGIGATEMLHIFIGSPEDEIRPGATGRPVPGYEARVVDAEGNEVAAQHARPSRRARADRMPLSRRQAPARLCARRLEHHRRHLPHGCRRVLLVPGALRRHDRVGRLQHRRPGGRDRTAHAPGGRRMRRGRRARRGARADRQGLRRAAPRPRRRRRP